MRVVVDGDVKLRNITPRLQGRMPGRRPFLTFISALDFV